MDWRDALRFMAAVPLIGGALLPVGAVAGEVAARGPRGGLTVHGADETLRDYCRVVDGKMWLELPGGGRWELITSTADPTIANPGDGTFHPFDASVVRQAIGATSFPLDGVEAEIYILPFPRRSGLESAAGPGLVLLSPGVRPMSAERQHAEVVHELGHIVQYELMPDGHEAWTRYRALRGIEDLTVYSAVAPHADRPHEIFAEDFRALFGGALANYSGTIENADLAAPATIEGLRELMLGLAGKSAATLELSAFPNPGRGAMEIHRAATSPAAAVDLFDLSGRRIVTLEPRAEGGRWAWRWDGRDASGRGISRGVLYARERGTRGPALRLVRLSD
jgi:hypothetical protein